MERTFTIEFFVEEGVQYVYISTDGASGCKYEYDPKTDDIGELISDYIDDYRNEF